MSKNSCYVFKLFPVPSYKGSNLEGKATEVVVLKKDATIVPSLGS